MPTWFRVVLGIVGVLVALIALKINIAFYRSYGTDADTQWTFTALAVVSLAIKLLAPAAAPYSPSKLATLCLWVSFVAAVAFDSLGTAGYVEMTYGTKTGQASRYADEYKKAGDNVSQLEKDYKAYAAERPTAEVAAALDAARLAVKAASDAAGKCTPRRAHLDACKAVADAERQAGLVEQELARADERDKRERLWREAKVKFDELDKPKLAADPQGAVFERLGSRIGLVGLKSFVAVIISVLIFAFFELGGPALVYVALHTQGGSRPAQSRFIPAARPHTAGVKRQRTSAPADTNSVLAAFRALLDGSSSVPGVSASGRQLAGSQRALGKACGVSAAKLNRILRELRSAGTIATRTGPEGTVIEIL
jgi:hypothetical protein